MFENIVAALDGSACSQKAFEAALDLGASSHAALHVCTAVDPVAMTEGMTPGGIAESNVEEARAAAQAIVDAGVAAARARGLQASGDVLMGEPAYEIVQYAKRLGADGLVLGTHGRTGLKRLFMGSVAESVLREAPCAVLIVREAA
ncbi:MAG TPA: universal stress protein [Verrucomicrobiae bacterium]|nr:universal stress protein [Verrucomicrobiae bacterium]